MISQVTLARPYAEAVFMRAKETGSADQWSGMLAFLAALMADERLARLAVDPRVDKARRAEFLLDVCEDRLTDEAKNFVRLLVANNRLTLIGVIRDLFEQHRADDEGYVDVDVRTAFPMAEPQQQTLAASLERTLKRTVRLHLQEDDSLIGGVRIRAGDTVIDGSVRGQLEQLAKRLST